jgi:apolipoprotein N-acyltransferase
MEFILIILSSLLFTAPYYFPALFFLSWFAFIPLIYLVREHDYSHSLIIALLVGFLNSVFTLHWLYQPLNFALKMPFSFNLFILFIYFLISALPLVFWVIINKFLQPKYSYSPIIAALSWSVLEYLRFEFFNFNPFNYFAYTQSDFSLIVQYAGYGGIFLVSFIAVLIASYLVKIYLDPDWKKLIPLLFIFLLLALIPFFAKINFKEEVVSESVDLLVAEPAAADNNFEKIEKEIANLTNLIKNNENEIIFTPEKSLSFDLIRNNYYRDQLFAKLENNLAASYLQLGAAAAENKNYKSEVYNSLFLLSKEMEVIQRSNKQGNIMTEMNFPFLEEVTGLMSDYLNFNPGSAKKTAATAEVNINDLAYLNLFAEEIFIPLVDRKQNRAEDRNLIVHSAAEGDFKSRVYNNLSFAAAVFRASESSTDLIRVVRGGFSGYITEKGKTAFKSRLVNSSQTVNLTLNKGQAYYQKYPLRIIIILTAIFSLIVIIKLIILIKNKWSSRN